MSVSILFIRNLISMKAEFTYKTDIFKYVVAGSFFAHTALVLGSPFIHNSPEFSVVRAENNVEVFLVEKPLPSRNTESNIKDLVLLDNRHGTVIKVAVENEKVDMQKTQQNQATGKFYEEPTENISQRGAYFVAEPIGIVNPAPIYPQMAKRRGYEGMVLLKVKVGKMGEVESVALDKSSGHLILDNEAIETVKGWKFKPAKSEYIPLSSTVSVPILFQIVD